MAAKTGVDHLAEGLAVALEKACLLMIYTGGRKVPKRHRELAAQALKERFGYTDEELEAFRQEKPEKISTKHRTSFVEAEVTVSRPKK